VKRFLVIGLGNFGAILAERLYKLGQEVIAIDLRAEVVDAMGAKVSRAVVGDATKRSILEEVGAREADVAVVTTGENLAGSILALLALRDLHVKTIFVKVRSDEHARIAEALGAEEVVFPERESALGLASRVATGALLQYLQLGNRLSIQEMAVPLSWAGKTLRELALPEKFRVQIVAVHDMLRDEMVAVPPPDRALTQSDALIVAGEPAVLERLAQLR
jgi:trk system potassium uptake protein